MKTSFSAALQATPEYTVFQEIVKENIGDFPNVSFSDHGLSDHRIRIFDGNRKPEIVISERAIVTSEYLGDVIFHAMNEQSVEHASRLLAVLYGIELFLRNRIQGLAFIAHGYEKLGLMRTKSSAVLSRLVDFSPQDGRVKNLTRIFYPLAHEIGHLPSSQCIAPSMLRGEEFREVIPFNYPLVDNFTGQFDFQDAQVREDSLLFISNLREEAVSDWFAMAALSFLVFRSVSTGPDKKIEFPLFDFLLSALSQSMVNGLQGMLLGSDLSVRNIQEAALAFHCRYSICIDSLRSILKTIFPGSENVIDDEVDRAFAETDKCFMVIHEALLELFRLQERFFELDENDVTRLISDTALECQKQVTLGNLFKQILDDSRGYPIRAGNRKFLEESWKVLLTFDTVVIGEKGTWLKR